MSSLSARPASTPTSQTYMWLKSPSSRESQLSGRYDFVEPAIPPYDMDYPVQRSLAPQRVMLSHRIFAYYGLIRNSRPLPLPYSLSGGSLPYGLVWAGIERLPNLICLSFPIVPSSVPRRLDGCSWLLLHRPLWPSPPSHRLGIRNLTLAGSSRKKCYTRLQSSLYATAR